MDLFTLVTFTIAYAIAVAIPGPGIAAVVARALGGGFGNAVPMVLGVLVGDLVYLTIAAFGLSALAGLHPGVFLAIRIAGALYLLYIAYTFWTAKPGEERIAPKVEAIWPTFMAGLSLTMGNPKTIVFYLALLPTVVPLDQMTLFAYAELFVIVIIVLLLIGFGYAWLASRARELFTSPEQLRRLNRFAAIVMVGAAGLVVVA